MRDLMESARKGPKALYRSLADFPHRHPLMIAGFLGGLALVLLIFAPSGLLDQQDEINVQRNEITQVRALCGQKSLGTSPEAQEAARRCAERTRIALINCRASPACRRALLLAQQSPAPTTTMQDSEGVVIGGGQNPSGEPGGGSPPSPGQHPGHEQQPGGNGGGGDQGGGQGQNGGGSEGGGPAAEGPQGPQGPQGPAGQEGGGSEGGQSSGLGKVGESVEGVVEGAGEAVEGVTEGVNEVVCGALERLNPNCPK